MPKVDPMNQFETSCERGVFDTLMAPQDQAQSLANLRHGMTLRLPAFGLMAISPLKPQRKVSIDACVCARGYQYDVSSRSCVACEAPRGASGQGAASKSRSTKLLYPF